jgi:hypothetical protein
MERSSIKADTIMLPVVRGREDLEVRSLWEDTVEGDKVHCVDV